MKNRVASITATAFLVAFAILSSFSPASAQSGTFAGVDGHWVNGSASVTMSGGKTTIKLSGDFQSQSGPDLYVYVGNGNPTKRIAKLKKFKGGQSYTYSGTTPVTSVHVYCKRYSVGFGTAKLN
jgi:hypothetical protein